MHTFNPDYEHQFGHAPHKDIKDFRLALERRLGNLTMSPVAKICRWVDSGGGSVFSSCASWTPRRSGYDDGIRVRDRDGCWHGWSGSAV